MALLCLGQTDDAQAAIQSALAADPENASSHVAQGRICLSRGARERALERVQPRSANG